MKKTTFFSVAKQMSVLFAVISFIVFFLWNTNANAQNTKGKSEQDGKSINNVSAWKSTVQLQKQTPIASINSQPTIQKTESTIKEAKVVNPQEYSVNQISTTKQGYSPKSKELIEKRDAQSRTFLNPDGSYTKIQTNGYLHYKDANGNWTSFDGTLVQDYSNSNIYEVSKTDLPISIDISTGKTTMALEKDQYMSFGDNVDMIVMDKNFNEVSRIADSKSKNNSVKEKSVSFKNSWANIDRQQEVDYWFAKSDYVINTKPNYNNTDGYLVFEDKINLPAGWQIIKSTEGEETVTGWQGDLIILNSSGKEAGRFQTPIYYESANGSAEKRSCSATKKESDVQNLDKSAEKDRTIIGSYRIKESGGKYTLSVIVPLSWLIAANRAYPVIIDPTASNTYASGNIASCYYSTFNSVNMNVTVPNGSTVTATNSQCTYVAVSPSWLSNGYIGFVSGSNLDGYWYCNTNSAGTCNVTGTSNSTIANGTYSTGTVPFTLKVSRDYPSGSCSTTNLYVSNSTWTETVTYTTPCTAPGTPTLASPANNANVQSGKTIHFTWNAPTTGTTPFTYTLYFYNGSSWSNYSASSNTYFDLLLTEYNSATWCGTNAQWYVKATNSCGNTNSSTWNLLPYPKYSGSTADYTITPSSSCQTTGAHSIVQGGADYYSFSATAGGTYYFTTCGTDLGCGTSTTWDTYLKIFGTNGSCTTSAYNDDGGACSNGTSFINGWVCTTSGTYYLQITGYNSSAYGTYYIDYKYTPPCTSPGTPTLTSPANNANIQPGKITHYTWNAPSTGTAPFYYRFYFYNGSTWSSWACDTNKYIDIQLLEYNSVTWCGTNAQWYVKDSNSCGTNTSATRNIIPYPKYSGSTADYTITPSGGCQTSGAHSIIQGGADYYSFNATAGNTYYFSTCSSDLGCGTNTGWDTYLKIFGTDGSCTTSAYNDDGGACTHNESFINGWACTTSGTYYVQITGYNSSAYGTYYLQYKESCPTLTASLTGGSSPICYNTAPAMFTATGSGGSGTYTYLWYKNGTSTGVTTQTYTTPALTANATIYCAVSSCGQTTNTSTYSVTVYGNLTANISGGTTPICSGTSLGTFTATGSGGTGSYTYLWYKNGTSTGITTQTYNPGNLTVSTSFYCAVTSSTCGTVNTSTKNITVNPLPNASAGRDTAICKGSSTTLHASGGTTYSWSPSTGLSSTSIYNPVASPTNTTAYLVTVTNSSGCSGTAAVMVTVNPLPIASAKPTDTSICIGSSVTLIANGGTSYSWSPSTGLSSTTIYDPIASPTSTLSYAVTVSNAYGCTASAGVKVTVNPLPNVSAGRDTAICKGSSTTLHASGGTTFAWSPSTGLSSASIYNPVASPTNTTTYTVTATNSGGCSGTATITVTINPVPIANADSNLYYYLTGIPLHASGGTPPYTFVWSPQNPFPNSATTYTLIVTDAKGCSSSDTTNFNPGPNAGPCGAIFISEYVQDTLNHDDAIELYNPTASTINLNNYYLFGSNNGLMSGDPPFMINLSGTIPAYKTFVIANTNADTALKNKANMLSDSLNFKGLDVVALIYISPGASSITGLDKIGDDTIFPSATGWVVGSGSTKNHTLIRKSSIQQGNTNWNTCQNEWNVYPRGTFSHLGHFTNHCTPGDPDITFSFANSQETGTSPRYFEFDVMAEASDNSTYFDNCLLRINYNTIAFGNNVIANNKVIITKGANFNKATYIDPNTNSIDLSPDTLDVPFGTDFSQPSWNRTLVTSSPQQLLHFKIEITTCNQNSNLQFIDTSFTPMFSSYTDLATDSITQFISYDNTFYSNSLNQLLCKVNINDFTSPVNAGVGDILTITGSNFGSTRGTGQVKFINADNCCGTYVQKINATDYVLWSNTQIKIRVPNFVDSVSSTPQVPFAIGGGNFIIKNSSGDSAVSSNNVAGKSFKIYYNINQERNSTMSTKEKDEINLRSTNGSGNGYTFRLNPTDFPTNSNQRGIFAKAMRDWICFSGANFQIGADTSLIYVDSLSDGVNYISFSSSLNPYTAASTTLRPSSCGNGTATLREADMRFNTSTTFVYDSTGTVAIPSGDMDFYGVCLHELGHVVELAHNADPNDLMFWTANSGPLTAAQRKKLEVYTSPADGGLYSVVQSINNNNITSCGWPKMIGLNNSCNNGINELKNDDYFTLYPNPSYGTFAIETKVNEYTLIITNVLGEIILSRKLQTEKSEIDISNQASGIYFIMVKYKNRTGIQKLILQK
jgi:hypothetical protein